MYSVEQKNGARGCYHSGSCWHTVFLHSTVQRCRAYNPIYTPGKMGLPGLQSKLQDFGLTIYYQPAYIIMAINVRFFTEASVNSRIFVFGRIFGYFDNRRFGFGRRSKFPFRFNTVWEKTKQNIANEGTPHNEHYNTLYRRADNI